MMRKGDLRQYPVEWVLRAAAEERLSGGIEFHAGPTVCVHLAGGGVYLALASGDDVPDDEGSARRHTVSALAELLDRRDGWYFFHPLDHHPLRGAWRWDVDGLLAEARPSPEPVLVPAGAPTRADEAFAAAATVAAAVRGAAATTVPGTGRPAPAPPTARVTLAPTVPADALSDEAWAVVSAMAAPIGPGELAVRLGWDRRRLDRALAGLAVAGVVGAPLREDPSPLPLDPEPEAEPPSAAPPAPAAGPVAEGPDAAGGPDGDLVGADDEGDGGSRQNALRRLIRSLRPAS